MAEDRMDRFERNLNRYAEESKQRMTHLEQFLANFSREVARNTLESNIRIKSAEDTLDQLAELLTRTYKQTNERMDRTDKEIAQLSHEIRFLLAAIQGHTSQPAPPAHQE